MNVSYDKLHEEIMLLRRQLEDSRAINQRQYAELLEERRVAESRKAQVTEYGRTVENQRIQLESASAELKRLKLDLAEAERKAVVEEDITEVVIVDGSGSTRVLKTIDGYKLLFSKDRDGSRLTIEHKKVKCGSSYYIVDGKGGGFTVTCTEEPTRWHTHSVKLAGAGWLNWETAQ